MVITTPSRLLRMLSPHRKTADSPFDQEMQVLASDLHLFSEEHIRFLAESLPEIVWTALPSGRHDFMNKRWFAYTGLTEEETYLELRTAVHPEDFPLYKKLWQTSIETGKHYEVEYRFRRASDGMYRWHLGRALPVRDERGKIIKWFGTCVDIHAQKEAEEEIRRMNRELETAVLERTKYLQKEIRQRRRAEERYREHSQLLQRMIDMFPMAAVAIDGRGAILHANEQFHRLFGIVAEADHPAATAHPFPGLLSIIRKRFPSSECERALRAILGSRIAARHEIPAQDGRIFLFEYIPTDHATPLLPSVQLKDGDDDTAGESGYLLLIRDISREKKIEKAKSEFMSLASHQLRTPLTSVRWALGRLARVLHNRLNNAESQLLQRARNSSLAMSQTITTMLSISRIEAGLHSVKSVDVRLDVFLQNLWQNFAELCSERAISFTLDCPAELQVHTDPAILREILENLLTNAIKYTPDGGAVSLAAGSDDESVMIRVRDTGRGIPAHEQKNVFGKFFRGENVVKIDTNGTGLGLYLVSQLVNTLKGNITFTSEEGKGTEFALGLPAGVRES